MFGKKKVIIVNRKDIVPPHLLNPMEKRQSFKQTKFDKYDIPGETAKSVQKIILAALALFAIWFVRECYLSWNIFQP